MKESISKRKARERDVWYWCFVLIKTILRLGLGPRKHGRGWEGAAPEFDMARRGTRRPTLLPARRCCILFFFFFFSQIHAYLARFALNQDVSAISGRIGQQLKQAEIGLESSQNNRNSHLRGIVTCFLASSFFVL